MKLQDFLDSGVRYDFRQIAANPELARQIQIRLIALNLLEPPADGKFGPLSTAALQRFQKLTNCNETEFLGRITAKKLIETKEVRPMLVLNAVKDTVLKAKPLASNMLTASEKETIAGGRQITIVSYEAVRDHVRITLRDFAIGGKSTWYVYHTHAKIYDGNKLIFPKTRPATVRLDVPYKSQLDNLENPYGACNVTCLAKILEFLFGEEVRRSSDGQFEDELYRYAINMGYSRHDPYDLAQIIRDYGGKDRFTEHATIEEVLDWLAAGNPVIIHGYWTSFGHIVTGTGYDPEGLFIHDPYGEWFPNGYDNNASGAHIHHSFRLIRKLAMHDGNFWVHFVSA